MYRIFILKMTLLIFKQVEFAVAAWNPHQKGEAKVLEDVQHRATKVAHELSGKPYEERLKLLGLTSLKERRVRGDLIQWFNIVNCFDHVSWMNEPRLGYEETIHSRERQ